MSFLNPDDRSSRRRSKSGTRERSRSRSNVRAPSPPTTAAYGYAPRTPSSGMPGSFDDGNTSSTYEVRSPPGTMSGTRYESQTIPGASQYLPPPNAPPPNAPYPIDNGAWMSANHLADLPPHERPGYGAAQVRFPEQPLEDDDDLAYGDQQSTPGQSRQPSYNAGYAPQYPGPPPGPPPGNAQPSIGYAAQALPRDSRAGSYSYQYAPPPDKITYTTKPQGPARAPSYTQTTQPRPVEQLPREYSHERQSSYSQNATYVDITPGADGRNRASSTSRPHGRAVSFQQGNMEPPGLRPGSDRLSVNAGNGQYMGGAGGMPPPSPLLEAYTGTYQSMASPLALRPGKDDDDLSDLEPLSLSTSRNGNAKEKARDKLEREAKRSKDKKRITLYSDEAEEEAKLIAKALNHHNPDSGPIVEILPRLSHDQIWELRKEYRKQVKIQGKGINLPKHLKMKVTGNFGKAAYVTALGRWESEGYWANFWYQSHGSRRELLIESLMGRTNLEIRNIKDEFKDKRYSDSLSRCMEKELKMDKFRTAVLMVLEERRQEENDIYPIEYKTRDVEMLNRALNARQGGESAMLEIVVRRSDAHLREVLKIYERTYGENFARAALKKSNNLVGEVIAHILNGVINKPARDAVLLNHAIEDIASHNKDDELRYELLISRLVRIHWDRLHFMRVKKAYEERFRCDLQEELEDCTKGDLQAFLGQICAAK